MSIGLLFLPLFCLQLSHITEGLRTVYMTENCEDVNNIRLKRVTDSIKLELSRTYPNKFIECSTTLEAYSNHSDRILFGRYLRIYFEKVRISDETQTSDGLQIYKGYTDHIRLTETDFGVYGTYDKSGIRWRGSRDDLREFKSEPLPAFKLSFQGQVTSKLTGFTAIITSYTYPNSYGKCLENDFLCEYSRICISRKLLCDSYMHCGFKDNSNNENCPNDSPGRIGYQKSNRNIDIGLVLGCIVAIFILLVAILWLGIVCIQRSKLTNSSSSRRENNQNTQVERASIAENVLVAPAAVAPFWEPPPLYQEAVETNIVRNSSTFELPPPYQQHNRRDAEDCLDLVSNDVLAEEYANIHSTPRTNDSDTEETEVDDDKDEVTRRV